jgi:hypothetical protein
MMVGSTGATDAMWEVYISMNCGAPPRILPGEICLRFTLWQVGGSPSRLRTSAKKPRGLLSSSSWIPEMSRLIFTRKWRRQSRTSMLLRLKCSFWEAQRLGGESFALAISLDAILPPVHGNFRARERSVSW